jgi:hypothetical protein
MYNYLNRHPKDVKMNYLEHACFSLHISWYMAMGSVCAFIHAINPNWFEKSSTNTIRHLANITESID